MGNGRYILDSEGRPVPCEDLLTWGLWLQNSGQGRIVKQEEIDGVRISTVFTGADHNFRDTGPPILWETMTFSADNEPLGHYCDRCSGNREQAEAMHERMAELVRAEMAARKEAMIAVHELMAEAD